VTAIAKKPDSAPPLWIADPDDPTTKALVPAAERARWASRGWPDSSSPEPGDWVWLRHALHNGAWRCNAAAAPLQEVRDWYPGAPPEPVDLARPNKPAVSGDNKE
jgi:hypothetical protein